MTKKEVFDIGEESDERSELIYRIQFACLELDGIELARRLSLAECKLIGHYATTARLMDISTKRLGAILQKLLDRKAVREKELENK